MQKEGEKKIYWERDTERERVTVNVGPEQIAQTAKHSLLGSTLTSIWGSLRVFCSSMWQLGCQIKLGKAGSGANLPAAISRLHLTGSNTHRHTQKCFFLLPADPIWNIRKLCSCLQNLLLPQMDTEANTVLWKWSHRRTMQGSWPRGPGSRKSVCYSGALTHDPSNTRPVLTVSQVFIIPWPLNISQTTTAQIKSCYPHLCTFFLSAIHRMTSVLGLKCLNPPSFADRWLLTGWLSL